MPTLPNSEKKPAMDIPFPNMLLDSPDAAIEDGSGVFEGGKALQLNYGIDSDGGYARPELSAKSPGGRDAKRGKKNKAKGHTDTSTKRK